MTLVVVQKKQEAQYEVGLVDQYEVGLADQNLNEVGTTNRYILSGVSQKLQLLYQWLQYGFPL